MATKKKSTKMTAKHYITNFISTYIQKHDMLRNVPGDKRIAFENAIAGLKDFLNHLEKWKILYDSMIDERDKLGALIKEILQLDFLKISKSSSFINQNLEKYHYTKSSSSLSYGNHQSKLNSSSSSSNL